MVPNDGAIGELAANFRGDLIQAGDPGYDQARAVFNAMIDRRPAVVARPPVVARPKCCVSRSNSPQVRPVWARAVLASGSTKIPFMGERSMTMPPSHTP